MITYVFAKESCNNISHLVMWPWHSSYQVMGARPPPLESGQQKWHCVTFKAKSHKAGLLVDQQTQTRVQSRHAVGKPHHMKRSSVGALFSSLSLQVRPVQGPDMGMNETSDNSSSLAFVSFELRIQSAWRFLRRVTPLCPYESLNHRVGDIVKSLSFCVISLGWFVSQQWDVFYV